MICDCAGPFAGKPAPTGAGQVLRPAENRVGAGLPAKGPAQSTHNTNPTCNRFGKRRTTSWCERCNKSQSSSRAMG
ncbi:hypothetical protein C6A77_18860 [Pseudomonas sp. AFG_SD02_1510_Pfu_092]|nr:hypothetical protein C6A77_18860 [Pseudomonas sp. AFG_SD02_1510_Pfu_092]